MNLANAFDLLWWIWWSNPHKGIHADFHNQLPENISKGEVPSYLQLLELRGQFDLPNYPLERDWNHHGIQTLVLADSTERRQHLLKLAVLSLDHSIIQLTAADWQEKYQVDSAELAREIIKLWNTIPIELKSWSESLVFQFSILDPSLGTLNYRIDLTFAAWLRSQSPSLFKRWKITLPAAVQPAIKALPMPGLGQLQSLIEWLGEDLTEACSAVTQRLCPTDTAVEENSEAEDGSINDPIDDPINELFNRIQSTEASRYA